MQIAICVLAWCCVGELVTIVALLCLCRHLAGRLEDESEKVCALKLSMQCDEAAQRKWLKQLMYDLCILVETNNIETNDWTNNIKRRTVTITDYMMNMHRIIQLSIQHFKLKGK